MGNIHKVISNEKEYTLNFNSYAIMQVYKKYGSEGLAEVEVNKPLEFIFDMIRFGLMDNGRKTIEDADVYDFIDGLGGITSESVTKDIGGYIRKAFEVPESKKKDDQ